MIGLNKIGLNQVQLNRLHLNAPFPAYGKMAGGGGSGDGFPQLRDGNGTTAGTARRTAKITMKI